MPAFFTTNTIKAKPQPGPAKLKHLTSKQVQVKGFNLNVDPMKQYPEAALRARPTNSGKGGRIMSSQLRDMQDNKRRLTVMAERKAALARLAESKKAAAAHVEKPKGKPGPKPGVKKV